MTRKGIITIIVSIIVCMFTPAGMYVFIVPFLVGCIGGKKIRVFYFHYFFKQ